MKQARWKLLVAAALTLLPSVALGQPKGGGTAPATEPASGGEIELDEPQPAGEQPPAEQPTAEPTTGDTGGGGICEIDPSACPKQADIAKAATKDVKAEVYAVQQIYALRRHRVELQPYWSFTLNDQFVSHPGPGLGLNYYLTNVLAVGLNGNWYGGLNVDSDFNFENRRATRVAVPLNEYLANGNVNFTYVPLYGKFAGFSKFIFHYDMYLVGGVGAMWSRPLAVIDPDNRKFDWSAKVSFNAGLGLRVFINRWFAVTTELRDYIYPEKLEATTVAPTAVQQRDSSTWLDETRITNHVQAQLGVSIFLPFSWEYRLPK